MPKCRPGQIEQAGSILFRRLAVMSSFRDTFAAFHGE
jgi:hypothetical protein